MKAQIEFAMNCYKEDFAVQIKSTLDNSTEVIEKLSTAFTTEAIDNPLFLCVLLSSAYNALLSKPGIANKFIEDLLDSLRAEKAESKHVKIIKVGVIHSEKDDIEMMTSEKHMTH